QKFIPISLEKQKSYQDNSLKAARAANDPKPPVVAQILPGRYGVIGTAGTRYFKDTTNDNIYTTTIGRPIVTPNSKNTLTDELATKLDYARRIEMRPSSDPEKQQLVVASNGGDPKDQLQLGSTYDPYTTEIGR